MANTNLLAHALTALDRVLSPHLAEEEAEILPLAALLIEQVEWDALAEHAMTHFSGDKLWLIIGLILEAMSAEQSAYLYGQLPPPLLEFWNGVGRPQFDSFIVTVRG